MSSKSWTFVVCGLLLYFVCSGCDQFSRHETTVYEAWYSKNGQLFSVQAVTYKAAFDTQLVVYWYPGEPPTKLVNCIVRDKKNWEGQFADKSATLSMVNGKLEMQPPNDQFIFQQVSFIRYLLLKRKLNAK